MDGDLQMCPKPFRKFVERHHQGFGLVYAQRIRRKSPGARLCYFYFLQNDGKSLRVSLPLDSGILA